MNPENIKQSIQAVVDGLTPLAQKLQVPVEGLWGWAIRHNYAEAVFCFFVFLVCLGILFAYYKFMRYGCGSEKEDSCNRIYMNDWEWISVYGGVVAAIVFIFLIASLYDISMRLIAPEWSTMKDIISLIK